MLGYSIDNVLQMSASDRGVSHAAKNEGSHVGLHGMHTVHECDKHSTPLIGLLDN